MKILKRYYRWVKDDIWIFIGMMVVLLFVVYTRSWVPLFVQHSIDHLLGEEASQLPEFFQNFIGRGSTTRNQLLLTVVALLLLEGVREFLMYFRGKANAIFSERLSDRLRKSMYNHIQNLSFTYHKRVESGDLLQRATSDIETVRRFIASQFPEILRVISLFVFYMYHMLRMNVKMTLASIIVIPFIFGFSYLYFKRVQSIFLETEEAESKMSTTLQENLTGIRVVKAFANENFEIDKFDKHSNKYRELVSKIITNMAMYWSVSDLIVLGQYCVTVVFGAYLVIGGELTLGEYTVFYYYVQSLLWPIRGLGRIVADFGKSEIALNRIEEILNIDDEYIDDGELLPKINGTIELENVSFTFDDDTIPLLKDINLSINQGETLAIVGRTGSGKSTLVNLLVRLYEYTDGSIKFDGVELKDINKHHIRSNVGIVLQEPFLYSKTMFENIGLRSDEENKNAVHAAAKIASVHNDIMNFDQQYKTPIGERGVTLSGGQKQRVAIARTIISEKPILIFDDSLSAVDTETDLAIRKALNERSKDTTVIIITHRITTAMEADKIVIMDEGQIVERGNHQSLIESDGIYKKIWDIQSSTKTSEDIKEVS